MIHGVLLDIAGVILDGRTALPGAVEAMARLRKSDAPLRFLTNSTRTPRRVLLETMRAQGLEVEDTELFTPAAAACDWLAAHGHSLHLLVHPSLEEDFAGCASEGPPAVVVGDAGPYFTYEAMNAAFRQLSAGAPFIALAANRVFRDKDGELSLDAGAFIKALEFSSGMPPLVLGKPSPEFFAAACASMGCALSDAAMIGDDAEVDIAGALSAGIGTAILVRTGKYRAGDDALFDPRPTRVAPDISAAVDALLL